MSARYQLCEQVSTLPSQATATHTLIRGWPLRGNLADFRRDPVASLYAGWRRAGEVYNLQLGPRALSKHIVTAGGDYVWTVKDNQPHLREEIAITFQAPPCAPDFSAGPADFQTATTINKGHGRTETRTLTSSSSLPVSWIGQVRRKSFSLSGASRSIGRL